jgi:7-carboxy-7-deazaguanine synthase
VKKGYLSEIFVSFQGEGAWVGRRQLFIRTAGCHLRCRYCDTPDSLERQPFFRLQTTANVGQRIPNPVTTAGVTPYIDELLRAEGPVDGVSLTGGEPLLQAEFLVELLQGDGVPRPRLLETSGTQPGRLRLVLPWVDIVSMDIKLPSNSGEPPCWDAHKDFLFAARGKVYVKVPVNAGTDVVEVQRAARLVREVAAETPLFLQPIFDRHGQSDLNRQSLEALYSAGRRYLDDVRVLPQMHKVLGLP